MHDARSALCVIPAPGMDAALPSKALRLVGDLPLVGRAIAAALASRAFARVVVATDDRQVARVSREHGASVVIVPPAMALGQADRTGIVPHVLQTTERYGWTPATVFRVSVDYPLLPADLLQRAALRLSLGDVDSVVSVCSERAWSANSDPTRALPFAPELRVIDAVVAMTVEQLSRTGRMPSGRQGHVVLAAAKALRVATLEDLSRASRLLAPPATAGSVALAG